MKYYPVTTGGLKKILTSQFPDARPVHKDVDTIRTEREMVCYLLWMLNELQKFEGSEPKDIAKRGRWIGYIQGKMEAMDLILNAQNRALTREDVTAKKE